MMSTRVALRRWRFFLMLLLCGLLLMLAVVVGLRQVTSSLSVPLATVPSSNIEFTFYDGLPGDKLLPQPSVPASVRLSTQTATAKPVPSAPLSAQAHASEFFLQVASVQDLKQAKRLQAKLQAARYPGQLQVFDHEGVRWYRVLVGPYSETSQAQRVQRELLNQVDSSSLLITR